MKKRYRMSTTTRCVTENSKLFTFQLSKLSFREVIRISKFSISRLPPSRGPSLRILLSPEAERRPIDDFPVCGVCQIVSTSNDSWWDLIRTISVRPQQIRTRAVAAGALAVEIGSWAGPQRAISTSPGLPWRQLVPRYLQRNPRLPAFFVIWKAAVRGQGREVAAPVKLFGVIHKTHEG